MSKPNFQHSVHTAEGRIERATWMFGEANGKMSMGNVMAFLKEKGCTDDEITEALNRATNGGVVRAAFGM